MTLALELNYKLFLPGSKEVDMRLLSEKCVLDLMSDPFERKVLRSAYTYFNNLHDPLRCNTFALVMRELIRIAIARLAPDQTVKQTSWWIGDNGVVTRRERYRFVISGFLSDDVIARHPELGSDGVTKDLAKMVGNLSKYTHISPGTYELSDADASRFMEDVEDAVIAYAQAIIETQEAIHERVWEITQDSLNESLYDELPSELDTISSNTIPEQAAVEELETMDLSTQSAEITGHGWVEVELNYGKKVDAFSSSDSYPLNFEADVDPETLNVSIRMVDVDTSSFYE
jgi:hypothetical protein